MEVNQIICEEYLKSIGYKSFEFISITNNEKSRKILIKFQPADDEYRVYYQLDYDKYIKICRPLLLKKLIKNIKNGK